MIKALVFDFAGVIGSDVYWVWLKKNVADFENSRPLFCRLYNKVDKGEISNDIFVDSLSKATGIDRNHIWQEILNLIVINRELLNYIQTLKNTYQIGLFSNYTQEWLEEILLTYDLKKFFDVIVITSKYKFLKPEVQAFRIILDTLKLQKDEAVFIDDQKIHVDAAKAFGLQALHFTDVPSLKHDLSSLLKD